METSLYGTTYSSTRAVCFPPSYLSAANRDNGDTDENTKQSGKRMLSFFSVTYIKQSLLIITIHRRVNTITGGSIIKAPRNVITYRWMQPQSVAVTISFDRIGHEAINHNLQQVYTHLKQKMDRARRAPFGLGYCSACTGYL